MAQKQVWRMVDGMAVMCTDCAMNQVQLGGEDICKAPDEICTFLHKKLDRQKTWDDFHEAYHELNPVNGEAEE